MSEDRLNIQTGDVQSEENLLLFQLPVLCFPLFDVAHFTCAALQLRAEYGQLFARQHPVASCLAMLSSSFAGSLLASLALGLPAVSPLQREDKVMLAVLVWLFVFFSPLDVGHRLARSRLVFTLFSGMKEVYRVRKIMRGISLAQSHYPSSMLIPGLVGILKGNGSGLLKPLTGLICGVWRPEHSELLNPSLTTKLVALTAVFWVSGQLLVSFLSVQLLYSSLVLMFICCKMEQNLNLTGILLRMFQQLLSQSWKVQESLKQPETESQPDLGINNNDKNKED